jgi:hypothetical protein
LIEADRPLATAPAPTAGVVVGASAASAARTTTELPADDAEVAAATRVGLRAGPRALDAARRRTHRPGPGRGPGGPGRGPLPPPVEVGGNGYHGPAFPDDDPAPPDVTTEATTASPGTATAVIEVGAPRAAAVTDPDGDGTLTAPAGGGAWSGEAVAGAAADAWATGPGADGAAAGVGADGPVVAPGADVVAVGETTQVTAGRRARRHGVIVPLRVPLRTRLKATVGLFALVVVLGTAAALIVVGVALAGAQALSGL